jgi:hypothetical protein
MQNPPRKRRVYACEDALFALTGHGDHEIDGDVPESRTPGVLD